MLRELLRGLALVFMASSVIISNIFRSTRSDKRQLLGKNINSSTRTTTGLDVPALEPESNDSDSQPDR
jgi:lactate dehydrogenase-like 2-hydroxyacid dehydrogenase